MRRCIIVTLQSIYLLLLTIALLVGIQQRSIRLPVFGSTVEAPLNASAAEGTDFLSPTLLHGNLTLLHAMSSIVTTIMRPNDNNAVGLRCHQLSGSRYSYLQQNESATEATSKRQYLFALNLHNNIEVLPRLLCSLVETLRYLGPENCVVSIVEGRSTDGTYEVLQLLQPEIEKLGTKYFLQSSNINPLEFDEVDRQHRIVALSQLRNLAMAPLLGHPDLFHPNSTVIFLNDVAICPDDIVELIHQRLYQNADMTCGMDWTSAGTEATFYDVWVSRGINGDSFFEIPADGSWKYAHNLFWNDPATRANFNAKEPFQVFSCWNGAVAFIATPFLDGRIKFRSAADGECFQGEPQIFAKEMWYHGYGKIAVVPAVNLAYDIEAAKNVKGRKGFVTDLVTDVDIGSSLIVWRDSPPPEVKCMRSWVEQSWVPWDEFLG